jgi:hypothetical protein
MPLTTDTKLSARYLDDKILISTSHVWTYVRIPLVQYEFLSAAARQDLAVRMSVSLAQLISDNNTPVDVHLITTHSPYNIEEWKKNLTKRVTRQKPTPAFSSYVARMADRLNQIDFRKKEVFLGICLGPLQGKNSVKTKKSNRKNNSLLDPLYRIFDTIATAADIEDYVVSDEELEEWHKRADSVRRTLRQSALKALPASNTEVARLISKPLWPEPLRQPTPTYSNDEVWGPGSLRQLAEGVVEANYKWLKIEQMDDDGKWEEAYSATLCVSRFPDVLYFPEQEPWIHFAESLLVPHNADWSTRMSIVPPMKVQKDVGRKLADAKDQAQHIAETGAGVPLKIREQLEVATVLEYQIDKERFPWSYARHRVTVTGATPEEVTDRARTLIEKYRELNIDLVWPSGEQFELMLESMPGDKVRSSAYYQRQELNVISGGMPIASSDCGDRIEEAKDSQKGWLGPYLGATNSRVLQPVFFSPHVAMARNRPPGVAITGAPGGGKSFLAFTLAYQMAVSGVWTIYIDPKADAKPMGLLPGLGNPRVFDLRDGNDGMLDPFSLGSTKSESTLLALETLRLLLGGSVSEEREEALLNAIEKATQLPQPSLNSVVDILVQNTESTAARNLGAVLKTIRELPFARLCFAATGGQQLRPEDGLTVVTLLGLDLPNASTDPDDYSYENRLAVSVMYLLTRYARSLMLSMDKGHPKAICIDEAWAITSTPQGAKLIPEIARMGRSHNTALVLVSQNAGDLMAESVTNSISTKFAFRSTIPDEVNSVLEFFGLEEDENFQAYVRNLNNGECLMQDVDGRVSQIQIDNWDKKLMETFDTNPETRGKKVIS